MNSQLCNLSRRTLHRVDGGCNADEELIVLSPTLLSPFTQQPSLMAMPGLHAIHAAPYFLMSRLKRTSTVNYLDL